MTRLLLVLGSLLFSPWLATTSLATTYVRVEKDGTKTYSDRPIPGGVPVELEPAQTYTPAPVVEVAPNLPVDQRLLAQMDDFTYSGCGVTPANDETFTNPENIPVSVNLAPGLRPGDIMTLSIDGKVVGTNILSYVMNPVYRGSHTIQVTVKDQFGRVLCSSSATIHVMRPSINMPRRG
jgi:hypothetical protein